MALEDFRLREIWDVLKNGWKKLDGLGTEMKRSS